MYLTCPVCFCTHPKFLCENIHVWDMTPQVPLVLYTRDPLCYTQRIPLFVGPLGIVHTGSPLLYKWDPLLCVSDLLRGWYHLLTEKAHFLWIPWVLYKRDPLCRTSEISFCVYQISCEGDTICWLKRTIFCGSLWYWTNGIPFIVQVRSPFVCIRSPARVIPSADSICCGSQWYCTNGIPFLVQVKSPFVCIGSRSRVIWGGYSQWDRLNHRFLLQKRPIKETLFCKRDL